MRHKKGLTADHPARSKEAYAAATGPEGDHVRAFLDKSVRLRRTLSPPLENCLSFPRARPCGTYKGLRYLVLLQLSRDTAVQLEPDARQLAACAPSATADFEGSHLALHKVVEATGVYFRSADWQEQLAAWFHCLL